MSDEKDKKPDENKPDSSSEETQNEDTLRFEEVILNNEDSEEGEDPEGTKKKDTGEENSKEKTLSEAEQEKVRLAMSAKEGILASLKEHLLPAKQMPPSILPIIYIQSRPLFPHMMVPLIIEGKQLIHSLSVAKRKHNGYVAILCTKNDFDPEDPKFDQIETFGVVGKVVKDYRQTDQTVQALIEVQHRISFTKKIQEKPFYLAEFNIIVEGSVTLTDEIRAYNREILSGMKELIKLNQLIKEELSQFVQQINIEDPSRLADFAASLTSAEKSELQEILAEMNIEERLKKTLFLIKRELELSRLQAKISKQIEERITRHQREFFLKEQLKEIRKELGLSKDDKSQEVEKFKARAKKLKFNEEARNVFEEELEKLSFLEVQSPEYALCRNYLDWLTCLPWGVHRKENLDLAAAEKTLNKNQHGLTEVKDRILEFIATFILKKEVSGTILCLVGPPGVGKTSIGKSIAMALNRPFYRFSLGGMRDEVEIKGHRRTYVGAMPGKFIQALKITKKSNPVIMLDEIDKIGTGHFGDPASTLLETLDPEQNVNFRDHYLDVPFDFSKVFFICTANQIDQIPRPLLDRMEVMHLSGYIAEEKIQIAKKFLVPKQRKAHGLNASQIKFTDAGLKQIIEGYAREAGVRNLENQIKRICRKVAIKLIREEFTKETITPAKVESYLKKSIFDKEEILGHGIPGCVTGLAWTSMGGDILTIEAEKMLSENKGFKQSGQLGDVMKESSEIAYSYVLSNAKKFGGDPEFFKKYFVHLHVPAGATPKDGPSAGAAMATALISLMNNKPVKKYSAMTGELTLKGDILPIGGLREKIIAAKRAKIQTIIVPKTNEKDYDELPDYLKEGFEIHFLSNYEEVAKVLFQT